MASSEHMKDNGLLGTLVLLPAAILIPLLWFIARESKRGRQAKEIILGGLGLFSLWIGPLLWILVKKLRARLQKGESIGAIVIDFLISTFSSLWGVFNFAFAVILPLALLYIFVVSLRHSNWGGSAACFAVLWCWNVIMQLALQLDFD